MTRLKRINTQLPFAAAVADALESDGVPVHASVIYRGRNTVYAVDTPEALCCKEFGTPGAVKGFIYGMARIPKALRAFDNAVRLTEMGIETPEPVAALCRVAGGRLRQSYYVCRLLDGWTDLRGAEKRQDFSSLAKALAAFMNSLHRSGVFMKDFSPGNVLFRREENGSYRFALIDINRMSFDIVDRNILMSNFGTALDTAEGVAVLAREYAALQSDGDVVEKLANRVYARRQAALMRKKRIKNYFRHKK